MKHFYSLSSTPGKTGELYYQYFFQQQKLPYTYTALKCTDLPASISYLKEIGASGFSVSMPYKTQIISLLDEDDPFTARYNSCNTVVISDGKLSGYNSDYWGMKHVLSLLTIDNPISILGDGAMASMFMTYLGNAAQYSRRLGNWEQRNEITGTVINCTSYGTTSSDSPFEILPRVTTIVDLAINPGVLKMQAEAAGIKYITGREFYRMQFKKQFEIYTGVILTDSDMAKYD